MAAFVYLLRCADDTLYCGWSTDPERRLRQHQAGTASRYTRTRLPGGSRSIQREFASRSEAMREEVRIKRLSPAAGRAGPARLSERGRWRFATGPRRAPSARAPSTRTVTRVPLATRPMVTGGRPVAVSAPTPGHH